MRTALYTAMKNQLLLIVATTLIMMQFGIGWRIEIMGTIYEEGRQTGAIERNMDPIEYLKVSLSLNQLARITDIFTND